MRALLIAAALLAPGAQDQTPTFRTATRLVELTVTALDRKGVPVTDTGTGAQHHGVRARRAEHAGAPFQCIRYEAAGR